MNAASTGLARAIARQFSILRVGLMFLTRLPVGRLDDYQPEGSVRSLIYFPWIGALVGLIGATVAWLCFGHLSAWLAMLAVLLASVLVTGALHEDALADAADGLFGGRTPARRLEIMKDSRIGAYGVLALMFSFGARWVCLHDLALHDFPRLLCLLVAAPALARTSSVALLYALPYVRSEEAKGGAFAGATRGAVTGTLLASAGIAIVLLGLPLGLICLLVLAGITPLAGLYFHRQIGGVSGDCLGAAIQLVELGCYLAVTAITVPSTS